MASYARLLPAHAVASALADVPGPLVRGARRAISAAVPFFRRRRRCGASSLHRPLAHEGLGKTVSGTLVIVRSAGRMLDLLNPVPVLLNPF